MCERKPRVSDIPMEDLKKLYVQVEDTTLTEVRRAADQSEKEGNEAIAEYWARLQKMDARGAELNISSGTAGVT